MQIEAFWIVAYNALEKGVAVLGGAEACLHLLAWRNSQQLEHTVNLEQTQLLVACTLLASPCDPIHGFNTPLGIFWALEGDICAASGAITANS